MDGTRRTRWQQTVCGLWILVVVAVSGHAAPGAAAVTPDRPAAGGAVMAVAQACPPDCPAPPPNPAPCGGRPCGDVVLQDPCGGPCPSVGGGPSPKPLPAPGAGGSPTTTSVPPPDPAGAGTTVAGESSAPPLPGDDAAARVADGSGEAGSAGLPAVAVAVAAVALLAAAGSSIRARRGLRVPLQ